MSCCWLACTCSNQSNSVKRPCFPNIVGRNQARAGVGISQEGFGGLQGPALC